MYQYTTQKVGQASFILRIWGKMFPIEAIPAKLETYCKKTEKFGNSLAFDEEFDYNKKRSHRLVQLY